MNLGTPLTPEQIAAERATFWAKFSAKPTPEPSWSDYAAVMRQRRELYQSPPYRRMVLGEWIADPQRSPHGQGMAIDIDTSWHHSFAGPHKSPTQRLWEWFKRRLGVRSPSGRWGHP